MKKSIGAQQQQCRHELAQLIIRHHHVVLPCLAQALVALVIATGGTYRELAMNLDLIFQDEEKKRARHLKPDGEAH